MLLPYVAGDVATLEDGFNFLVVDVIPLCFIVCHLFEDRWYCLIIYISRWCDRCGRFKLCLK